ncbi:putative ATP-dependent DNA helicase DinG [Gordonia hirsuta DSM 44140 = NBRC 16056]|uniref:ATP-dependent helicase DinG n=1 Tax=Gordonia hirsuta DSM 44140 = NBRC 16056 TaxID=1121927 RepID=L7LEW8_9ACTN|nr:ATP-dependent DNA helicase [Gordonia hirsuta]GAC58617.1 putative ATP-dependent DNA helicase DinG [Gordonia hirsuta DSM 44140 = NBRC 16056]
MSDLPDVPALLAAAVSALGGSRRQGQVEMATAVAEAIDEDHHLAVQAGTGTGKSLAYLVPAIRHAVAARETVVVSTATIALQRQLTERDLPRLAAALTEPLGREPDFAILKGRANYLCLSKIHAGAAPEPDAELFDAFDLSRMGRDITRLREWASQTETGDRDDLSPGVDNRSWRQVSVSSRECVGAAACEFGEDCFAEAARRRAAQSDVVVTNHAMLAIDAMSPANILPEHRVVVIDEAHELVDRITGVSTEEISAAGLTQVSRRAGKLISTQTAESLAGVSAQWEELLDQARLGEWIRLPAGSAELLAGLRDRLWEARTEIAPTGKKPGDADAAAARQMAFSAAENLHDTVVRVLSVFAEPEVTKRRDVVWVAEERLRGGNVRRTLNIAPLSVSGLLRTSLFTDSTVILTSATLTIGGSFNALARAWGLPPESADTGAVGSPVVAEYAGAEKPSWRGLDVGSPFDYPRSAILYVAKALPPPGRDGPTEASLDEMADLINAAGGRTLGLFSSMRAATAAAEALRERLGVPILCQGEDTTSALIETFAADEPTCLFGTLSLWQGVDVPGPALRLVLIDRIPFPRPDDPLLAARQREIDAHGGNGFLAVSANHAALLLAQGAGRLLRADGDRGVVAVLDSRLATARYGNYLVAGLPPFWRTTDPAAVRAALRRLTTGVPAS